MLPYQLRILFNVLATTVWINLIIEYILPYQFWPSCMFIAWTILMSSVHCMEVYVDAHRVRIPASLEDND